MLHTTDSEILFLKQEEVIKAGLLDMKFVLDAVDETYKLMGQGLIKNPPKTHMPIPDQDNWKSFFNSMPCYIGGDVHIAGVKWAAESKANAPIPGIPYGIDITVLSDPDTVLPFCICDGTLTTAMRTSAVGGTLAKFVAPRNAKTATLVGAGAIGRTMIMAVKEAVPTIETIYLCDLNLDRAKQTAEESPYKDRVEIIPSTESKACALKSQLIVTETTTPKPIVDKSWLTPGVGIVSMASNELAYEVGTAADVICIDYWDQMITNDAKLVTQMYKKGDVSKEDVNQLGDLCLGRKQGRTSDDQIAMGMSMGIGALDIMIAYKLYQEAVKLGIGTKVRLWDKPLWE